MERFLMTVVSLSLSGGALGLIVMLITHFGKQKLRSGFIYLCWALVLLRFALPLGGLIGLSTVNGNDASVKDAASESAAASFYVSPASRTDGLLTREDAYKNSRQAAQSGAGDASSAAPGSLSSGETGASANVKAETPVPAAAFYKTTEFWFYLWLGGALISFMGTVISFGRFRRLLFRTLKPARPLDSSVLGALNASPYPALYRSDKVSSTVLLGLIRPVIVLPDREYTSDDLDRILRHELTHYRRGDLALKWLQTLIYSVHWFNPLVYLFRTQTTLYCELSCDQKLLKRMDRQDKQSYGELLLNLAADRALPRRVIAVSFTTQKRDLKERLVQIMNFTKLGKQALALSLAVTMGIMAIAFVLGPAQASSAGNDNAAASEIAYETVRVSSVDEFLAAIGDNKTIVLAPGTYDLSTSSTYGWGQTDSYYWEELYGDGYELVLDAVKNLTIQGEEGAEIVTRPRSAAVIMLLGVNNVTLKDFTAGHTEMPDACQGAVIELYASSDVTVDNCVLYGCGTMGIQANECWKLKAVNTEIKECSVGAVDIENSYDVVIDGCRFHDCVARNGEPAWSIIDASNNTRLGIYNTEIFSNQAYTFVASSHTVGLEIMGCRVYDNSFDEGFAVYGDNVRVAQCEFAANGLNEYTWITGDHDYVLGSGVEALTPAALTAMSHSEYTAPEAVSTSAPNAKEYHVSTMDELLGAIGSDRTIYLDSDRYLISDATGYGKVNGENYYWTQNYDGYGLVVIGVKNMKLVSSSGKANIELLARSADVMTFKYSSGITLDSLILGHVNGMGSCMGDVVSFMGCTDCELNNCELFGCGVNGLNAYGCVNIHMNDSEIYDCSWFAAVISDCAGTEFNNVTIRDCTYNSIDTQRCRVKFSGTTYYSPDYTPKSFSWDDYGEYGEYDEYSTADYGYEFIPAEGFAIEVIEEDPEADF